MDSQNLKSLKEDTPFDQYSRQYQVTSIINELRSGNEHFTILDVGGYKGRTADFLPQDKTTVLDLFDVTEENYVQGSALEMPFADASFDCVLSFDVLEHIPGPEREKFFDECNRVAKRCIIICAPQKTTANEYAEKSLNDLYKKLHKKQHRWLREHIEYGIPDFGQLEKYALRKGLETARFHSNKIQLWAVMQQAIFMNSKFPLAAEKLTLINKFYNDNFEYDGGGLQEAAYRIILCCFRTKQDHESIAVKLGDHNKPINPALEVELYKEIGDFNATLVQKTNKLAENYKKLHKHELTRANALQSNNELLQSRIRTLEVKLPIRIKRKITSVGHKH